jgi:hypothetical protein
MVEMPQESQVSALGTAEAQRPSRGNRFVSDSDFLCALQCDVSDPKVSAWRAEAQEEVLRRGRVRHDNAVARC